MKNKLDQVPELESMRLGVDYRFEATIRGYRISFRPLTISEMNHITADVAQSLSMMPKEAQLRMMETTMMTKKILVKASTPSPERNEPQLTEYIMDRMTTDELQYLYKQWLSGCDRCNPALEQIDVDVLKQLVEQVKKSPSEAIELSFLELVNVCQYLTSRDAPTAK